MKEIVDKHPSTLLMKRKLSVVSGGWIPFLDSSSSLVWECGSMASLWYLKDGSLQEFRFSSYTVWGELQGILSNRV